MNNIEDKIKKALSEDIEIPNDYKYIIRNTLKERKNEKMKRNRVIKILATSCACLAITTSLVYAKDISNFVQNFFNHNNGMDKAISNGYIDEPDMEYVGSKEVPTNNIDIDARNTEIKIKNMLMDDYNLSFTFSLKVDDNIDISKIQNVSFPNMLITDENNKIIYCENKDIFDKFCKDNNLNYEYLSFNENYINNETNYYIKSISQEEHKIEVVYNFNTSIYPYPKNKRIVIDITQIGMSETEKSDKNEINLQGDWNINFDVAEKFYNRQSLVYTVARCSDETIDITEASLSETGMTFEFTSNDKPIYDENDSLEVKRQKIEEFEETNIVHYVVDEYIENENGEIFNPTESNFESSGTIYGVAGDFKHWQTFDLTKNDATNKLIIHFKLHLQGYSRDVIVELERK